MALDLESPEFDPLLALQSDQVVLPFRDARPLANLQEYENLTKGVSKVKSNPTLMGQSSSSTEPQREVSETRQPTFVKAPISKRHSKNVLAIMDEIKGPLGRLRQCMRDRTQIKVWTRRARDIRGVCTGFVLAFDRHWNMVLADVDETYVLPPKVKTMVHGDPPVPLRPSSTAPTAMDAMTQSFQDTVCLEGKTLFPGFKHSKGSLRRRHAPQIFIRGDNVALVALVQDPS